MGLSVFVKKYRSVACHRNKDIYSALFSELSCVLYYILVCLKLYSEHFAKLEIVGLYEERLVLENVQQQLLCGIYHKSYPSVAKTCHNTLINIRGKR